MNVLHLFKAPMFRFRIPWKKFIVGFNDLIAC